MSGARWRVDFPVLCPEAGLALRSPPCRTPFLHALRHRSSRLCSGASSVLRARPTPRLFPDGFGFRLPIAVRCAGARAGQVRSPLVRRFPFARDGVFDHGRASAPRMAAPHMLPSTILTASASTDFGFSRLNSPPHAIAVDASRRSSPPAPQHSLPSARYGLLGPDFHRLETASFAWRTSVTVNPGAGAGGGVGEAPGAGEAHRTGEAGGQRRLGNSYVNAEHAGCLEISYRIDLGQDHTKVQ